MSGEDLLAKAKATPKPRTGPYPRTFSDEDLAPIAAAWARGEITLRQLAAALGVPSAHSQNSYSYLCRGFRAYVKQQDEKERRP